MSIKQPKPIQIRLPFSVPRPSKGGKQPPPRLCGICRKNQSKYTCPRCNISYCALSCFQDLKHSQCSEGFYKEVVMESIEGDRGVGVDEKRKMMDLLRRYESLDDTELEGTLEGGVGSSSGLGARITELEDAEDEGEDVEDDLAKALEGIDLESIDSNQLFHLLPQSHRDKFLAALRNPESDDARELLDFAVKNEEASDSGGLAEESAKKMPDQLPWWEHSGLGDEDDLPYAPLPNMASEEVLAGISPPEGTGSRLAYNAIAISLAYLHTLLSFRLPSLDSYHLSAQNVSSQEIKEEISEFVPFLVEARSTLRYETLRAAWSAIWELIGSLSSPGGNNNATADEEDHLPPPIDLLIRLLTPLGNLLHPPLDTSEPPKLLLLLSDLYALFAQPKPNAPAPKKLLFCIAALRGLSRQDWLRLESEVQMEIETIKEEHGLHQPKEQENPNFLG